MIVVPAFMPLTTPPEERVCEAATDSVVAEARPPENTVAEPLLQKPLGTGVAVVLRAVSRMLPAKFQPDDVAGMPFVESRLLGGSDHIVGRRHHAGKRAHASQVVAHPSKRTNIRHGQALQARGM